MPNRFEVKLIDNSHYVMGLPWKDEELTDPDTMLIYHYDFGDIDTCMDTADKMLAALYDLYQTSGGLVEGDVFITEFGEFVCEGVHVMPYDEKAKAACTKAA